MMFKGIPMLIFMSTHEEHVFNVDKYVRLLCSDKSGFVQWDKIIERNGCKKLTKSRRVAKFFLNHSELSTSRCTDP